MKSIKRLIILIITSFFVIPVAYPQFTISGAEPILDKLRMDKRMDGSNYSSYSDIAGDPYLFKDFFPGRIIMKAGKTFQVNLRFDMHGNQINFREGDQIFTLLNPEKVGTIEIDSLRFIFCDYKKNSGDVLVEGGYYFILRLDGYCKLLIKKNVDVQDAEPPKLYQDAKPAKFINLPDTYYLKEQDNSAIQIKSKNVLLSFMEPQKDKIISFINAEKLGIKKVEDLEKIISFYNSLQ